MKFGMFSSGFACPMCMSVRRIGRSRRPKLVPEHVASCSEPPHRHHIPHTPLSALRVHSAFSRGRVYCNTTVSRTRTTPHLSSCSPETGPPAALQTATARHRTHAIARLLCMAALVFAMRNECMCGFCVCKNTAKKRKRQPVDNGSMPSIWNMARLSFPWTMEWF